MTDADLLFYDPASGDRLSYGDLRALIGRAEVPFRPVPVGPMDAKAAISELLIALILGHPLVLSESAADSEAAHSGGRVAGDAHGAFVSGRPFSSVAEMIEHARQGRGFSLTLSTSGSTGLPKQVEHSLGGLTRFLREGERHAKDVWGLAYNPTHIAGVQVILQAFFNGNAIIQLLGRDRDAAVSWIEAFGVTHVSATPSFYRLLLPAGRTLNGVRAVTLGGERADAALIDRLGRFFPHARIRNLYASTEAGTLFATEGEIFEVPPALAGLVRLRGPELELHRSLLGEFAGRAGPGGVEPWYATGDVTEIVSDNPLRFRILGREREWVNVGGQKVNPGEVESVLLACPGIREARVHGRPNSVLGQLLCAEVVSEGDLDEPELRRLLSERLQAVKVPRLIKRVPSLARTRTGKISRLL
jgi:acyl-coenzyme A synthetase/AMP-(fatty) acid ligase